MKILSPARRHVFDDIPKLSRDEGIGFTALDAKSRKITGAMHSDVNKVGFLIQRAYFQAKGRFFNTTQFNSIHKRMVERSLGLKAPVDLTKYNAKTASHHRSIILELYGWKPYKESDRRELEQHALLLVDKQKHGEVILFSLLDFCWKNKIEIPGYNELVDIIGRAFVDFEEAMRERVASNITEAQKVALLSIIDDPAVVKDFSDIKKVNQATTQRKLNYNAELLNYFKGIFFTIKPLLDNLFLTAEAIKHFSDQVHKSTLSQIKNIKDVNKQCLLLSAFVQDQFYLRQDYAMDAFIKSIRSTVNQGNNYNKSLKDKEEKQLQEANQSVLNSAKTSSQILKLIINISRDPLINLAEKNEKVLYLAESYFEAENPDLIDHIGRLETSINNYDLKINFNQYLFERSESLQRSYSPIIRIMVFDENNSENAIINAINFFQGDNALKMDHAPTEFLSEKDKNRVFSDNAIPIVTRYKLKLFIAIERSVRKKSVTLKYSYRYRASHTYMISDEQWNLRKNDFLKAAALDKYTDGKGMLTSMGKSLTQTYDDINRRIQNNDNELISFDKDGNWKIKDSEPDFDTSKYIPQLLSTSKPILLYELLSEIDGYTEFTESFHHHSLRHSKKSIEKKLLFGTLMSLGTNLGHTELAKASRGLTEKQLRDTEKLWFSEEVLHKANQHIVEFIQNLPLPTIYNGIDNTLHTSSDGKKVVVAVDSLLANYSYKYYGKEQGITVNSFLDSKQTFFHVNVLTSSDREAPYMLDGLVKSTSTLFREMNIQEHDAVDAEHLHSTDTHGYTEAMFAALHFLDVSFAPRIAKIYKQTLYAYEAKSLRKNTKNPIAPNTPINKKLILDNWDDILRLMATIKLNYCSASLIFKMLSASASDSPLYAAIKEFGRLIKSKFILNYIDDEDLRRSITKQLNRVELGQKLAGRVFYGRGSRLHVGSPVEMQRVMLCKTILQNAIILWNYLYLSDYYSRLETKGEKRVVSEMISTGSVIAWKHINMMGIFDFDHDIPNSFKSSIKQMMTIKMEDWESDAQ